MYIEKRIPANQYGDYLGIAFGAKCAHEYGCDPIQRDDSGHYLVPDYLAMAFAQRRKEIQERALSRGYCMDEANSIASRAEQHALKRIDDIACERLPNTYLCGRFPVGERP
ncbi:hypothetical protein [Xanthobacter aminoxidans]|uniref:hypothetical protein n=1 Tax=Xanthobacter aminoxidans TaxID=186280 RepID=UPI002022C752|nr:hypothetical protein [Xanthobacter aminoxidans]MCL8382479.1 hypothetical protein [Xanthobacter aminoxidans]